MSEINNTPTNTNMKNYFFSVIAIAVTCSVVTTLLVLFVFTEKETYSTVSETNATNTTTSDDTPTPPASAEVDTDLQAKAAQINQNIQERNQRLDELYAQENSYIEAGEEIPIELLQEINELESGL